MNYHLIVTDDCNLKCSYCYEREKNANYMSEEILNYLPVFFETYENQKFIGQSKTKIFFNGGEAFLNYSFIKQAVSKFRSMGIDNFSISTNLTLLNDEIIEFICKNKISLHISIDGKQNTHDKNRVFISGKGSYEIVKKNIDKIQKIVPYGVNSFNLTFTSDTVSELYENVKFLLDQNIHRFATTWVSESNWGQETYNIFKNQIELIADLYIETLRKGINLEYKLFDNAIESSLNGKYGCGVVTNEISIIPDGSVLPCGMFVGQENYKDFIIGNVYSNSLNLEVINNFIQSEIDYSECHDCDSFYRCQNKCFAVNYIVNKNIYHIPDCFCVLNQIVFSGIDRVVTTLVEEKNELFITKHKIKI